jgi:hypothetical protein
MWYVYIDWTTEQTPRPFYIGKGTQSRLQSESRNAFHDNVANKHGLKRETVFETNNEKDAYEYEIKMIAIHHTFIDDPAYNGIGTNFTTGGDGGYTPSIVTRQKISVNTSIAMKKLPPKTQSHREALSRARKGYKASAMAKLNMSKANKGRKPWNKGKTYSCPRQSEVMKSKNFHITENHKEALRLGRERYNAERDFPVLCYDKNNVLLHEFNSLRNAIEWIKSQGFTTTSHISACLRGTRKKACGYVWKKRNI